MIRPPFCERSKLRISNPATGKAVVAVVQFQNRVRAQPQWFLAAFKARLEQPEAL